MTHFINSYADSRFLTNGGAMVMGYTNVYADQIMKTFYFLFLSLCLTTCALTNAKFVRKKITHGDITVLWYYYSNISNNSHDFIEIEKNGSKNQVFKAMESILNVSIKDSSLFIKIVRPSIRPISILEAPKEAFGFKVVFDTTGKLNELSLRPDARKN